jgi:hypothetical protein
MNLNRRKKVKKEKKDDTLSKLAQEPLRQKTRAELELEEQKRARVEAIK